MSARSSTSRNLAVLLGVGLATPAGAGKGHAGRRRADPPDVPGLDLSPARPLPDRGARGPDPGGVAGDRLDLDRTFWHNSICAIAIFILALFDRGTVGLASAISAMSCDGPPACRPAAPADRTGAALPGEPRLSGQPGSRAHLLLEPQERLAALARSARVRLPEKTIVDSRACGAERTSRACSGRCSRRGSSPGSPGGSPRPA